MFEDYTYEKLLPESGRNPVAYDALFWRCTRGPGRSAFLYLMTGAAIRLAIWALRIFLP